MAAVILALTTESAFGGGALAEHPVYGARPLLRGRLHQVAAVTSVPLGIHLVGSLAAPGARVPVLVYALTGSLMFAASAAYHRLAQGLVARFWMRRVDHSMIFVHVAGATTPVASLGLGGSGGRVLMAASWIGAAIGAALKMTRLTADHDPCSWVFPVLGVLPLFALPGLAGQIGWDGALLLVASAATYLAGAICFARKSPDPVPRVFGYHEVWHVFTVIAGAFQFLLTSNLASGAQ
jgi:hemolysin III